MKFPVCVGYVANIKSTLLVWRHCKNRLVTITICNSPWRRRYAIKEIAGTSYRDCGTAANIWNISLRSSLYVCV